MPKVILLILAWPGSEETMRALWVRALGEDQAGIFDIRVITDTGKKLQEIAADIVCDEDIPDGDIILVPANTFPTQRIERAELRLPLVYVQKNGLEIYDHRLPKVVTKKLLADILAEGVDVPEVFAEKVVKATGSVPVEAGMAFGNIVTQVLRGDPCQHSVIEAFIRKKYVATSPEGWKAIEPLVQKLLSE